MVNDMEYDGIPKPGSRFLLVRCNGCRSEQVIFGCASTIIRCIICNEILAVPGKRKAKVRTKIVQVLG